MSLFVDLKYIHLVSPRLQGFHRKSDHLFNCRCFLCGDSQKTKTKMRGFFFRQKDHFLYKCHNCGRSIKIATVLKQLDATLYKEYVLETYSDTHQKSTRSVTTSRSIPAVRFDTVKRTTINHAERCDYLPEQHYCRQYLTQRQIPFSMWSRLYFTENYEQVIKDLAPQEVHKVRPDARLLIPYYDAYGALTAISGRALAADSSIRYVTIRTVPSTDKLIYGLDRIDTDRPLFITEGPLDSLFLDNAVASGDANLALVAKRVQHEDIYLVFDNERRNKELVTMMEQAIRAGHRVMFWPDTVRGKDINEMIVNGHTAQELIALILSHSVSGLRATTELTFWKKVMVCKR